MKSCKKKILIIRPGAIGDVVHTTIIPISIKKKYPDYEIHYLTQSGIAPLLENNPYIDKVIPLERSKRKDFGYFMEICHILREEKYDVVFCLTISLRNLLFSLFSFPKRIALRKRTKGLWVEDFFATAKSVFPDIEMADRLYLETGQEQKGVIDKFLSKYPRPYTVFVPAGRNDKNRQGRIWNINNWKILSELIIDKYGGTMFVCGSKAESQSHEVLAGESVVITSGNFSIAETGALLSNADLVISGDTGPVHIASGYNVKTLSLIGSTSPNKIKPYGKNGYYVTAENGCKHCWKKKCKHLKSGEIYTPCMESITPDMVMGKIVENNLL